jgi:hypothetical protein
LHLIEFQFQSLSFEFLWHIIFFPIWWYSAGTIRAAKSAIRLLAEGNDILVPGLWAKNIFTPMFGQTDWQGRMVSFFYSFCQCYYQIDFIVVLASHCHNYFFALACNSAFCFGHVYSVAHPIICCLKKLRQYQFWLARPARVPAISESALAISAAP